MVGWLVRLFGCWLLLVGGWRGAEDYLFWLYVSERNHDKNKQTSFFRI